MTTTYNLNYLPPISTGPNPDRSYLENAGAVAQKSFGIGWGFDCLGTSVPSLISAEVEPDAIWPYVTGNDGIAWAETQISHFAGARVYRVNQGLIQGPAEALNGDEFDMETGAWTLDHLLAIVAARRRVSLVDPGLLHLEQLRVHQRGARAGRHGPVGVLPDRRLEP